MDDQGIVDRIANAIEWIENRVDLIRSAKEEKAERERIKQEFLAYVRRYQEDQERLKSADGILAKN